jgi:hypothetical protein
VDLDRARATVAKFATVARARSKTEFEDGAGLKTSVGRPATLFSEMIMVS